MLSWFRSGKCVYYILVRLSVHLRNRQINAVEDKCINYTSTPPPRHNLPTI